MPRQRAERVERTCERPECKEVFEVRVGTADERRRYCSRPCARMVENQARSVAKQKAWAKSPESLCACGVGRIPYEVRATTKYCTPECRRIYGKKRQPDPANHVTFVCQNPKCPREGEPLTRPKGYGNGHLKYCSNECARTHTKTKQHIVIEDAVVLDSPWEALFWGLCAFLKLPAERYARERGVAWNSSGWYAPDFWLPQQELAVEAKGQEDPDDAERWARFRTERGPLVVLGRADLDVARRAQTRVELLAALSAMATAQASA